MTNLSMETVGLACRCVTSELFMKLPPNKTGSPSEIKTRDCTISQPNLRHSHLGQYNTQPLLQDLLIHAEKWTRYFEERT